MINVGDIVSVLSLRSWDRGYMLGEIFKVRSVKRKEDTILLGKAEDGPYISELQVMVLHHRGGR